MKNKKSYFGGNCFLIFLNFKQQGLQQKVIRLIT